jgi:hypothetical protein
VVDPSTREESNLWAGLAENSITKNGPRNPPSSIELPKGFPIASESVALEATDIPDGLIKAMEEESLSSNPLKRQFPGVQFPLRLDPLKAEEGKLTAPCRVYSGWANAKKLQNFIANDCQPLVESDGSNTIFFLSPTGVIYYRKTKESTTRNILSVLRNFSTTEKMRSEIEAMGLSFNYPKPKELVQHLLQIATSKDSLILDSFAGSGTTGQSTLELNQKDHGNRRFILVEMDEKTASNITAKRLRRVIEGYDQYDDPSKPVAPIGGGFRYCRLGTPLFNEFGDIDGGVIFPDLAAHIFFSETGSPLPKKVDGSTPFIGTHKEKAVYLLFSPAEQGFAREASGNVLTPDALAHLPAPSNDFEGVRIVYAEGCTVSPERLKAEGVIFKQIPYQIEGN